MSATAPHAPTLPRSSSFTRQLTPTWLGTAALLTGQRPPDLVRANRYVHLGCGSGETAAVIAACHPATEVWAWDPRPEHLEAARRLGEAAGLANLVVHESPDLPPGLGGGPADVIAIQDLLVHADDALRSRVVGAVREGLRAGGLLCVTYPTLVGWVEIAPVQALLHRLAAGRHLPVDELVAEVLGVVEQLRAGGARYLTERPVVVAWLEHLRTLDPEHLAARYLRDPFRPMSPAQVAATFAPAGAERIGAARLTDDLDRDLPPGLVAAIAAAPDPVVRETYRDLATRRSYRVDLFRRGRAPLSTDERDGLLGGLGLAGLAGPEEPPAVPVDPDTWRQLLSFGALAGDLHPEPAEAGRLLRILMDAGQVHPLVARGPGRTAIEACEALNVALAAVAPAGGAVQAIPLLGTAATAGRAAALRARPPARAGG